VTEDFQAGFGESVVVNAARIAQQGAVNVEEIGVVQVPTGKRAMRSGTPGDTTPRSDEGLMNRRDGWFDCRIRQSGRRLLKRIGERLSG
jgi:hypothetical protein